MLRKFILKDANGYELVLPVAPASWQGEAGRKANNLTMYIMGAVNLPGSHILLDEELDCLLPARDYPFNTPGTVTDPWHYLTQLIRWSNEGTVLRFIVSGTDVNEAVILDPIRYREQDGTNDIYCTIPLRGYRELTAETFETVNRAVSSMTITKNTYTVEAGDTLSAIARKFYGDPSLYGKLAAANGIKNANLIYPGQVLKIPDAKVLPAASVNNNGGVAAGSKQPESVKLSVEYTGSKTYFGAVYANYQLPQGPLGVRTVTNKDSFAIAAGSKVEISWKSTGSGRSDYCIVNSKQINSSGNRYVFEVKKDSKLYIHWTGLRL